MTLLGLVLAFLVLLFTAIVCAASGRLAAAATLHCLATAVAVRCILN